MNQEYKTQIPVRRPRVFIFEGPDFTGKTTLSKHFVQEIQRLQPSKNVLWMRSPGGSPEAEKLRDRCKQADVGVMEQADLYLQAFEHTVAYIDSLPKDTLLVFDRWTPSLYIYQMAEVQKLEHHLHNLHKAQKLHQRADRINDYRFGGRGTPVIFNLTISDDVFRQRRDIKRDAKETDRFESFDDKRQLDIVHRYQSLERHEKMQAFNLVDVNTDRSLSYLLTRFSVLAQNFI